MLDVFFLFSRYLSTKNMWSLWFWIMSPNMKPYETFEKLRNKLLFGWSWHLKFSKQWTSLECPMPFCIPVHHVCFGSKINQRKTPFLGYLTSRSTHLEFLFLSVDRVTYLPSYRLVILSYAKKCRHLCCLFPMGLKMSKLAVDTQTVLKTLGFLLQVFFDFSKSLFGGQKFLVIIKPQQTRGSYARLQGGGSSQQCSRVNHIPLWAKKKKSYRGSTQDSFYSEGRYPNVQIWLRDTLRFSVWRKFGGASFVLCYLSSSQLTSFATFSPVKMDDSKNLWRVNPCETRSFFFFKKKTWTKFPTFKLIHWTNLQSCFIEATFKVVDSIPTNPPKPIYTKIERVNSDPAKFGRVQFLPFRLGTSSQVDPHVYDGDGARSAQGRATEMSRGAGSGEDGQGGLGGALGRQQKPKENQQNLLKASQPPFF